MPDEADSFNTHCWALIAAVFRVPAKKKHLVFFSETQYTTRVQQMKATFQMTLTFASASAHALPSAW